MSGFMKLLEDGTYTGDGGAQTALKDPGLRALAVIADMLNGYEDGTIKAAHGILGPDMRLPSNARERFMELITYVRQLAAARPGSEEGSAAAAKANAILRPYAPQPPELSLAWDGSLIYYSAPPKMSLDVNELDFDIEYDFFRMLIEAIQRGKFSGLRNCETCGRYIVAQRRSTRYCNKKTCGEQLKRQDEAFTLEHRRGEKQRYHVSELTAQIAACVKAKRPTPEERKRLDEMKSLKSIFQSGKWSEKHVLKSKQLRRPRRRK